MKDKDSLRLEQIEETLRPYRRLLDLQLPRRGWVHAIKEALGMSNRQLAGRVGVKASQTVEDMQEYEVSGTIKLQTLRKLANALDCQLVYALVPRKPLKQIRRDRARVVASRLLKRVSHSMRLEDQGVSKRMEDSELDRRVEKLLAGNPKALWD
jgi:predicted DNA-binding mobile mystery protein A